MVTEARPGSPLSGGWLAAPGSQSIARLLSYFVASRLLLWAVVDYALHVKHPRLHPRALHDFGAATFTPLLRWDVWWYVSVVEDGYRFAPHEASNVAFLPGFPALIAFFSPVFRSAGLAAFVVANAAFVAALLVFWGWVKDRAGIAAAERSVIWLIVYPFSFFFNTGYAESIFFLLATLTLRAIDEEDHPSAALYASLATLTRPMGLFFVPACALGLALAYRASRASRRGLLPVFLPLLSLGSFAVFLWMRHGTPLAMWTAQRVGWGVGQHWSLFTLPGRADPFRQLADVWHVLVPIPLLVLSVRVFRAFGVVAGAYSLLTAALGVLLGGDSVGREVLAVVPVFALAGLWNPGPVTTAALRVLSFSLLVTFTYAFALGHFMG